MITLVGRSSSHFTRVARVFAHELDVPHAFRPVLDLASAELATYADNPALKIPVLVDEQGSLFGTENICRALAERSGKRTNVVLRGDVDDRLVANAEELTLHAMSAEVVAILAQASGGQASPKVLPSLENSLGWLDAHVDDLLGRLPSGKVAFVEVALFCLVTHLPFRQVMEVDRWSRLGAFRQRFGERTSARATEYRFDAA